MTLTVSNLVAALDRFPAYHAIDVFADDLAELRQPTPSSMRPLDAPGRSFLVRDQGRDFKLEIFPERGLARLSKNGSAPTATGGVTGTSAGSLFGAAINAANTQKGAGLLGGALLGLAGKTVGAEPDESYIVGADQSKDRPDLVIEVIWTSGGIDKLTIYQRLGIDEIWIWIAGQIEVHSLRGRNYERAARSRCLPALDLDLMCTFLDRRSVHVAKRGFREALRQTPQDRLP